jgi:hypothetical protein
VDIFRPVGRLSLLLVATQTNQQKIKMILLNKILTEVIRIKSASRTGFTVVGFIAYYHDGINKTSSEVFGITRKEAIHNLKNPTTA